ncbi:Rad54b [Symbiodinium necroappetens]|uniref:Rad54b protein n=1 Tax=Symbiodinium necroappetens TaxID=1628268 RepID=A0A812WNY3_9DINO|nr:Rad54b [Symbiodinium necroappetens]
MSGGATFQTIANELKPCRVSALLYDAEALQCNSVPELAACYNRRVPGLISAATRESASKR